MTKICNLDEIAPEELFIAWKAQEYPVVPLLIDEYGALLKDFQAFQGASASDQVRLGLDLMKRLVPSFPFKTARLSAPQLMRMLNFIMNAFNELVAGELGDEGEAPGEASGEAEGPSEKSTSAS